MKLYNQKDVNRYNIRKLASPLEYYMHPDNITQIEMSAYEDAWIERESMKALEYGLPENTKQFLPWYSSLCKLSKQESKPLFEHIANTCGEKELAFYIQMEGEVDGKFDDIIALSQIGLNPLSKMTLVENLWDEMGNGVMSEMHTTLFNESAAYFGNMLRENNMESFIEPGESALKNGNLLMVLANNRKHSAKLIGALTILEHTAPYRFNSTVKSMRRNNVPEKSIYYHEMHIAIDAKHGKELLNNVVMPLISEGGVKIMKEICIGLLIRKNVSNEYYSELRKKMNNIERTNVA